MQNYVVHLESPISKGFRCIKAANSLDIDVEKKSKHHLSINADLNKPFNVGLIIGASGSGKTTLAKKMFGDECFKTEYDISRPVIEQFPQDWSYDDCVAALNGIGLTSVPCWIRPMYTLSNGQKMRAEAALSLAKQDNSLTCIDEWTSVVDRTVAKVMSHCVAKHARKYDKKIILNSCHYDVIEWLNPDWIIDCNIQTYTDRRAMVGTFERTDQLRCEIREVDRKTWQNFSKYHYLSERLPGGKIYCFGLFEGLNQIGFGCYAAYIIGNHTTFFSNRVVIHPDYAGLGLGLKFINETAKIMVMRGFKVKTKFSSLPLHKARQKDPLWILKSVNKDFKSPSFGKYSSREKQFRTKVVSYSYDFIWKPE